MSEAFSAGGAGGGGGSAATGGRPSAVGDVGLLTDERGRSLRYISTSCRTVAFADVQRVSGAAPIATNRPALADRARLLLDRYQQTGASLRGVADALAQQGIDWRTNVQESAVCMDGKNLRLGVFAGSFDASKVMDALRSWARNGGHPEAIVNHEGRGFVQVSNMYVAPVAPSVVAVGPDMAAIDAVKSDQPGLQARGGDPAALVFIDSVRPWGGRVKANTLPLGEDAFVVRTSIDRNDGTYDPERDRPMLQQRADDLATKLKATPLAPLADAVSRTEIAFSGATAQLRTVLPSSALSASVAHAAVASGSDWVALFPGASPQAVGGGPAGAGGLGGAGGGAGSNGAAGAGGAGGAAGLAGGPSGTGGVNGSGGPMGGAGARTRGGAGGAPSP